MDPPFRTSSAMHSVRALAWLLVLATTSSCADPSPQPVAIGVIASQNFIDAAVLAIEHELAVSPIAGLDTAFVSEGTSRSEPALRFAEMFVNRPGMIAVVGHSNSAASIAASQIYNQAEVVQIAPTSTATLYGDAGPFSFRMVADDDAQGRFLARVLADSLDPGARLALLYVNDDYGRGLHRSLVQELESTSLEIALELPHAEDTGEAIDLEHLGSALIGSRPDAVVWLGRHHTLDFAIETIREALGDIPLYGSDGVSAAYRYSVDELAPGWNGVLMVDLLDGSGSDALARFNREFRERYDRMASAPDALTYDAVRLLLAGIREGARDGRSLREYLESLGGSRPPYPGVTGPVEFDERGDGPAAYQLLSYPPDPDQ